MYSKALTIAAIAGLAAASPAPAAVTSAIAPKESAPAGCVSDYGPFYISLTNVSHSKRDGDQALVSTLKGGVLTDGLGRTGYIASNSQYQYDAPPQAGALYTAGFSVCPNGTLALGDSTIFYACLSGTFYNIYDENEGAQCHQTFVNVSPASSSGGTTAAAQMPDGQVTGVPVASVACQIGDGQVQGNTCTAPVITQIKDGQIQANTGVPGVVTQINDGQIQAPTAPANVVTQIHDGQIQAPTAPANAVTQINDGQIQAPTNASVASATPVPFTGAASSISVGIFSVAAGIIAVLAL